MISEIKSNARYLIMVLLYFTVAVCLTPISLAAAPPYPPSRQIRGITWDHPTSIVRKALGSDNFAMTCGKDGKLYTVWGDGGGFGGSNAKGRVSLGVSQIDGSPQHFVAQNIFGGINSKTKPNFGGKSYGILSVAGTLYMWVGPGSAWEANTKTRLAWSKDNGKTWKLGEVFFGYKDGFSLPTFLNFGCDYAGSRDNYVYIYSYDASNGSRGPYTKINLARVPLNRIKKRSAYVFYNSKDAKGSPLWTRDISQRVPVFEDRQGGALTPSVIYNPGIGRYLLAVPHGKPSRPYGGLGIFDSPEPWGPWTTVEYVDSWMGSTNLFYAVLPSKWISSDGLTLHLVFSGYGKDIVARDAYQHIRGVLNISKDKN